MVLKHLRAIAKPVMDIVYPPRCAGCRAMVGRTESLCAECWGKLHFITEPQCGRCGLPFEYGIGAGALCGECLGEEPQFTQARAALKFDENSKDYVHHFKFHDRTQLAPLLAEWMQRAGAEMLEGADFIVPVPLHRWRLLKRRFNQAAVLAYALSKRTGVAVLPDAISRKRYTTPQTGLSREQRLKNVRGAFKVTKPVRGKRLVLVDDVMTTGATLKACTRVLKRAGAKEVFILTLARTV